MQRTQIFSGFGESQLRLLARSMVVVSYPKGAVLFEASTPDNRFFLVLSGTVRLTVEKPANGGRPVTTDIARLSRGDAMGELALLAGEAHGATAIAEDATELLVLHKRDFDELLETHRSLGRQLSRLLLSRLAAFQRKRDAERAPGRVVSLFAAVPPQTRALIAVHLAAALQRETRKPTLLFVVEDPRAPVAPLLRITPAPATDGWFRDAGLTDPTLFESVLRTHPSGITVFSIDQDVFLSRCGEMVHGLLSLIRGRYETCLVILPCRAEDTVVRAAEESNRIAAVTDRTGSAEDADAVFQIAGHRPSGKKLERIWLAHSPDDMPGGFRPDLRLPWSASWAEISAKTGSPQLPDDAAPAIRGLGRLARSLAERTIGFAMGSGAAYGYALIGMLKVMEREGIFPDVVSGTSMGALLGAFYAAGMTPAEIEDIACSITKRRLWAMTDLALPRSGFIKGNGLLAFVRTHLGRKTFRDLELPFCCVATDIDTGREVILEDGDVAEAVRASVSLPFFFEPYCLNGRYLVDGGLVNPVPTAPLIGRGADICIAANLTSKAGEKRMPVIHGWRRRLKPQLRGPSIPEVMMKTIFTMQYEISIARAELAHVTLPFHGGDFMWWDLHRAKEIIRLGEVCAEEHMPKLKMFIPTPAAGETAVFQSEAPEERHAA